jgi:hypothetical protein
MTPVTVDFEILNLTASDLVVDMSWETDALSAVGIDLDPRDAVDMRLLIVNAAGDIVAEADGGSFETSMIEGAFDDGVYTVAADIYSTIDAGDFNSSLTIGIDLEFNQVGKINHMVVSFPGVMTNDFPCDAYRTNLAEVTKSGDSYEIGKAVSYVEPQPLSWSGTDAHYIIGDKTDYDSEITTVSGCTFLIYGLNSGWMQDFWGEEILDEGNVVWTLEGDVVTIESQYVFTTLYDGAEYVYTVSGTGTYDDSGATPTMELHYILDQEGFNPSGWAFDNGYMDTPDFVATITQD